MTFSEKEKHYMLFNTFKESVESILEYIRNRRDGIYPAKDIYNVGTWLDENKDMSNVSDGYHTFGELYEHRHALFIALLKCYPAISWKTVLDSEGQRLDGWFIAGMDTKYGQITYHLPMRYWDIAGVKVIYKNKNYDGHTSADVVERLLFLSPGNYE